MLTEKEMEIINDIISKGYDVEIQQRKDAIVIIKVDKKIVYKKNN